MGDGAITGPGSDGKEALPNPHQAAIDWLAGQCAGERF